MADELLVINWLKVSFLKIKSLLKGGKTLLPIKCILLALVVTFASVEAQLVPFEIPFKGYQQGADTVSNHQHLAPFFNKLTILRLADTCRTKVNIIHIGDSHIQGDFLTSELRNAMQLYFGNAGRGLVFPHRLARSNESFDYRSQSSNRWQWASIRSRKPATLPGFAGISLFSTDDMQEFSLFLNQRDSVETSFDYLQLICRNDSSPNIAFVETNTHERQLIGFANDTLYHIPFKHAATMFSLQTSTKLIVDGVVLGKNTKGIQYHVIGINGAHYSDYNKSDVFFTEMQFLHPDLVLISLGTNEGVNASITAQGVEIEASHMLANIRAAGISCPVVLITPFDNFYRRSKINIHLKKVQEGICKAAQHNNIAYIDMYSITGGQSSALQWRAQGLITSDRIHYNATGYRLQGKMIFNTLINSYLKYAKH